MPDFPPLDQVPTPSVVAACLVLDRLATERVPWWAAAWLAGGQDGTALRALAGLDGRDPHAVRDLLPTALAEMGVVVPTERTAAGIAVYDDLARICLDGRASERWVSEKVEEVVSESGYADALIHAPLGGVYLLAEEWARVGDAQSLSWPKSWSRRASSNSRSELNGSYRYAALIRN